MTATEMNTSFKLSLDKSDALNYPSFSDTEIDFWLNVAQDRFVKQRLYGDEPKHKSIKNSPKRMDDLKSILKRVILVADTGDNRGDGGIAYIMPSDYKFYIKSETKISRANIIVDTTARYVENKLITHDDLDKVLRTAYNNPILRKPCVLLEFDDDSTPANLGNIIVYKDADTSITEFTLIYIMNYNTISSVANPDVNCQLPNHTHQEIVDIAVNLVIENIESPRVQTNDVKLIGSE